MNWTTSCATKLVTLGLLIVLGDASEVIVNATASCFVRMNGDLPEPQPLIMSPGTGRGFLYPKYSGYIELSVGESVRLVCLGSYVTATVPARLPEVTAYCISGTSFSIPGPLSKDFKDLSCQKYPEPTAQRTGVACPKGDFCEIGFDLGGADFQRLMTVCHDRVTANTIVVHEKIPTVINTAQKSFARKEFVKGDFYDTIPMPRIYNRMVQRATLAKSIGSAKANFYIPQTGNFYLIRGHLAAKSDFVYGDQQRASFFYLNTLPMWQNINVGNWLALETSIRKLATQRGRNINVWIGGIDVLKFADPRGNLKEFYLYETNRRKAVPVPKFLFKLVWEKSTGLGAAFITVNNPYLKKLDLEHTLCKDVSSQIRYLTWVPKRSDRGLSYACEIDEFRKAFPYLSNFRTTGLLVG